MDREQGTPRKMTMSIRFELETPTSLCDESSSRAMVSATAMATLGSRLRLLRETLGMTQEEVSIRSVDEDGRILRRIEVGHVESGRNMASTRRVRLGLARAFSVTDDEMFDYLEGRVPLPEFMKLRGQKRKRLGARAEETKSLQEQAIEILLTDGYGTAVDVRRAAARARQTFPADKQALLGILEWANLIETTLRQMRRVGDPAASSAVTHRAQQAGSGGAHKMKGRRSA
jgi:transcriptional regulator with XRE-family HTH domain